MSGRTEPVRVLFLPGSGPGVGGGHVLRCLTLARALAERGARPRFATAPEGRRLLERFGQGAGFPWVERGEDPSTLLAPGERTGAVVVDDYAMAPALEAALASVAPLVVLDDLADRPHPARLLVDPGFGRQAADYAALLPPGATVLAGPRYALVRPDFAGAAPVRAGAAVARLFVSFGLADPGGIAGRAVAALLPALPAPVRFDVALGAEAQSLPALRRLAEAEPRLRLHVESAEVAALMAAADMAVGAGGSSTWERAVLGLPSISVIVADNQRALAHALAAEGVQATLEADDPAFPARLAEAASALAADALRRAAYAARGRALCDGRGAGRVAQAVLAMARAAP